MLPILISKSRARALGDTGVLGPDEQRFSYPSGIQARTLNSALLGVPESCKIRLWFVS